MVPSGGAQPPGGAAIAIARRTAVRRSVGLVLHKSLLVTGRSIKTNRRTRNANATQRNAQRNMMEDDPETKRAHLVLEFVALRE